MALLLNDGFGLWNSVASALQVKGWTAGGNPSYAVARSSTSVSARLASTIGLSRDLTMSGVVGILSAAVSITTTGSGTDVPHLSMAPGAGAYGGATAVRFTASLEGTDVRLKVMHGATLLADLGLFARDKWYYLELWAEWAASGRVIARVDESVRYDSGPGGVALAAATGTLSVALRRVVSATLSTRFADVLVMDGSGSTFNGFQGDVIIETLFPTADGANSGWTPNAPGPFTVTNRTRASNVATLTVSTVHGIDVGDSITVAGVADASFNGTLTVTAVGSTTLSYANAGSNVGTTASGGTVAWNETSHKSRVNESPLNNADTDYVSTATVNAVDTYAMQDLATPAGSAVLAVRPVLVARKESAFAMGIAPTVRSAGTDYPGTARDLPNTLAYSAESDTLTVDPATGAPWTRAAVDAIEVGPKKTA